MMTEQEAREKWCPMARAVLGMDLDEMRGIVGNRTGPMETGVAATHCFASYCMAWRWVFEPVEYGGSSTEIVWAGQGKPPTHIQTDRGFCGLAGKP